MILHRLLLLPHLGIGLQQFFPGQTLGQQLLKWNGQRRIPVKIKLIRDSRYGFSYGEQVKVTELKFIVGRKVLIAYVAPPTTETMLSTVSDLLCILWFKRAKLNSQDKPLKVREYTGL